MAHACSKRDKNILRPFCGFFLAGRDRSKRIPRTTTRNTRTFTHSDTRVSERKRVSRRLTFYQWHNRNLVFLGDAASVRAQVAKLGWRSNAGVGKLARYRELQLPSSTHANRMDEESVSRSPVWETVDEISGEQSIRYTTWIEGNLIRTLQMRP